MLETEKNQPVRDKKNFLVFGSPDIDEAEIHEVVDSLRSGWLGTGPKVLQFEQDFKAYKQAHFAIAVNSCTAALHLSILASGVSTGDEVITTAMTFCATINAIIHSGATPVLIDCNSTTHCINPQAIEDKITSRTKAILPVHFAGNACEMDTIMSIAKGYKLKVIEDCAHAIETTYKGRHVGTLGDFGCFSFYVTKNVVTGEGGMVLAKRKEDADKIKILALHGMSHDAWRRFSDDGYKHYKVVQAGFKYNMMDLQASIGIHQLKKIQKNWQRRQAIWRRYKEELKNLPIALPADPLPYIKHGYHLFAILIDKEKTGIGRDEFLSAMHRENIGTGVHYLSIPTHPYYNRVYGWNPEDYPNSYMVGQQTVSLPLSSKLTDADVSDIIIAVRKIIDKRTRLSIPISNLLDEEFVEKELNTRNIYLECRENGRQLNGYRQDILHFDKNIIHPWSEYEKDSICAKLYAKKELKLITFHMSTSCSNPILRKGIFYNGGIEFTRQEMLSNARHNTQWLKGLIGDRDTEIAVENNNYYPTPAYNYITDADFINQVVFENQLGFVFDIAHAKITAHNKRESCHNYIAELPMRKMMQLHVSKHKINEDGLAYDAHELPDEPILEEVKEIISKFSPKYITIEYYKDRNNLIKILEKCKQLCIS